MWTRLLHTSLFLIGLLGTAAGIRHLEPLPFWSSSRTKFEFLAQHLGDYDTVFVGSSRIHRGIVPERFDRRMAELGVPTQSFNLGLAGARPHDFEAMVGWLVEQRSPQLRRVVIELHAYEQGSRDGNWLTDFDVEMHQFSFLAGRLHSLAIDRHDLATKGANLGFLVAHAATNLFRIGQGVRIAQATLARWCGAVPPVAQPLPARGFDPLTPATAPANRVAQYEQWRAAPQQAEKMLGWKRGPGLPRYLEQGRGSFNVAAFRRQNVRLRAAGIEPLYVVMPVYSNSFFGREVLAELAAEATILVLDDQETCSDIFRFDYWFDSDHLLPEGAERFSGLLAERIAAVR